MFKRPEELIMAVLAAWLDWNKRLGKPAKVTTKP